MNRGESGLGAGWGGGHLGWGGALKMEKGGAFSEADGRLSLEAGGVCVSTVVSPFRLHRNVF